MKKVLVTGGAGYIGSHTSVALAEAGFIPIILDNFSNSEPWVINQISDVIGKPILFYEGDCMDQEFLKRIVGEEKDIFGVIHFAAFKAVKESVIKPIKYYQNNIGSTEAILELMISSGIQNFVFSSSCTVYGNPDKLPVDERAPFKTATSPYGRTKQICEELISDTINSGVNLKSLSLRYFNPIGAHETAKIGELPIGIPENLVPFITQTAAGVRDELVVFGTDYPTKDGSCIRDYIHVMDLAEAHVKSLQYISNQRSNSFNDVINLGIGEGRSVFPLARI